MARRKPARSITIDRMTRMVCGVMIPSITLPRLQEAEDIALRTLGALGKSQSEARHLFWLAIEMLAKSEQISNGT